MFLDLWMSPCVLGHWLAFYSIAKIRHEKPLERSGRIRGHQTGVQYEPKDGANRNTSGKCLMVPWLNFLHTLPFDLLYICELSNLSVFDHHALGVAGSNLLTSALRNTSSGGRCAVYRTSRHTNRRLIPQAERSFQHRGNIWSVVSLTPIPY